MSIDEAIENEKELSEHCKRMFEEMSAEDKLANKLLKSEIQYHEQLAEWLEELVMLRLDSCMIHMPERLHLVENGYNKALNDFVNFAKTMPTVEEEDGTIRPMWLEEMAEHLKAGGENDNLRR